MAKRLSRFLALSIAAGIVGGFLGSSGTLLLVHPPNCVAVGQRQEETQKESLPPPSTGIRPPTADERVATYTGWLAILTAALVLVSIFQGCILIQADRTARITANAAKDSAVAAKDSSDTNRDLVNVSKDTAQKQLRAYVFIDEVKVVGRSPIQIDLRIKNSGQTPARDVRIEAGVDKGNGSSPANSGAIFALGPQGEASDSLKFEKTLLDDTEMLAISVDRLPVLLLLGRITYTNAFGAKCWTIFQFESCGGTLPDTVQMRMSKLGNDYA